jgi:hypothetical protein
LITTQQYIIYSKKNFKERKISIMNKTDNKISY